MPQNRRFKYCLHRFLEGADVYDATWGDLNLLKMVDKIAGKPKNN